MRWNPVKSVVVAMFFCGLLGMVPYPAHSQEQSEVATVQEQVAQSAAPTGVVTSNWNPLQIAILHWYNASPTTQISVSAPVGMAFDGANIWVANQTTNAVTKLRASDGTNLGTFAVGRNPRNISFDGANIWVANQASTTVTKLRASDGTNLGTFAVGNNPQGVAFDGANIWAANGGSTTVTKLRASDGTNLGTFAVGSSPNGVAFDGANIWVANESSATVTKLRASDG